MFRWLKPSYKAQITHVIYFQGAPFALCFVCMMLTCHVQIGSPGRWLLLQDTCYRQNLQPMTFTPNATPMDMFCNMPKGM